MIYLKAFISGMVLFFMVAGCSETELLTGPAAESDSGISVTDGNSDAADSEDDSGDGSNTTVIEFMLGNLPYDCGWDNDDFPNPYGEIHFEESPRWAICWKGGIQGMTEQVINPMDTRFYSSGDVLHTTVAHLPEPVDEISLSTANHRAKRGNGEYYSSLTAFDEEGNEIDIDENTEYYRNPNNNRFQATVLTVSGNSGSRIYSVGVTTYQNATYLANLKAVINTTQEEEIDETPPVLYYTTEQDSLWPVNHKMVLAVSSIYAEDETSESVTPEIGVESDEPVNGEGDGNTEPDWDIVDNGDGSYDVYLRAERSGTGDGRVYTVTVRAEDEAGNTSSESVEITVPHQKESGS